MTYRIFLVEDDRSIAEGLQHQLEQWNFEVRVVQNFRGVLGEFTAFDPSGSDGHYAALLRRLPLVPGDTPCLRSSHHLSLFRIGQHEPHHGNEHGR